MSTTFRNIKALGLALVAVFAMSAIATSAAQAEPTLELGAAEAEVTATQVEGNHVFTVDGNNVECTTATLHLWVK